MNEDNTITGSKLTDSAIIPSRITFREIIKTRHILFFAGLAEGDYLITEDGYLIDLNITRNGTDN